MSARAACRLELLGFSDVYRYTRGKADWLAAGLPTEGPGAGKLRPGALARRDVPTCSPEESIAAARRRVEGSSEDRCVVVSETRVVLGIIDAGTLTTTSPDRRADEVMRAGPATVRADADLTGLLDRMHGKGAGTILVTDPDGRLIGTLHRDDADAAVGAGSPLGGPTA